jgi:hypothetical protein
MTENNKQEKLETEHEFGAEILMTNEVGNEMIGFCKNLASEIRLYENLDDAVTHLSDNFDVLADNFQAIQEASKSSVDRLWQGLGTHEYQLSVLEYIKKISENVDHYIKEKGDKSEKYISAELSRANAIRITLPEPYYTSVDQSIKYYDIWFVEPTGATVLKYNHLFSLLSNIKLEVLNVNEYLKHSDIIMEFCVESRLLLLQDGKPFIETTLADVRPHVLMFFFLVFSTFCKDGDFLKHKARLKGK